jgi:hypothetical protein
VPRSDAVVLVWNFAIPGRTLTWGGGPSKDNVWGPREPLVFAVSKDGCRTWTCPTVIHEGCPAIYARLHLTDTEMYVLCQFLPTDAEHYHIGLAVYDLQEVLKQPAWTHETIKPYIDAGLVAPWVDRSIP